MKGAIPFPQSLPSHHALHTTRSTLLTPHHSSPCTCTLVLPLHPLPGPCSHHSTIIPISTHSASSELTTPSYNLRSPSPLILSAPSLLHPSKLLRPHYWYKSLLNSGLLMSSLVPYHYPSPPWQGLHRQPHKLLLMGPIIGAQLS